MNGFTSKMIGWLALLVGGVGVLAVVTLILFFVSFFQNVPSLDLMEAINDSLNSLAGIFSAIPYAYIVA